MKNVITIFHKSSSPSSTRILNLLKQHQATSTATATKSQASNHSLHDQEERTGNFELDVSEANPTSDQLRSILDFVGDQNVGKLIPGEKDKRMAIEKVTKDAESFQRPVVCYSDLQRTLRDTMYYIYQNHRSWTGMVEKQVLAESLSFSQMKLSLTSHWR